MDDNLADEQASFGLPSVHHHWETCDGGRHDELPVRFLSGASSGMQDKSRKCMHRRFDRWHLARLLGMYMHCRKEALLAVGFDWVLRSTARPIRRLTGSESSPPMPGSPRHT